MAAVVVLGQTLGPDADHFFPERRAHLEDDHLLTDACAPHLAAVRSLEDLQLHETSVGPAGLTELAALPNLRNLLVPLRSLERHANGDRARVYAELLALSKRMPRCEILAKGRGTFTDGVFLGSWSD
ncbi:hypothetical protein PPSIR1_34712 [Plesiocystis pacifica SIR-1]|uniref:Uncharacterized protein n=1 Tax=Plesiocystis pacifica SIR-1 TaxID=391625 RepID=A6GE83_9BACT|nr:hypothetical protein [Plesiocystis pacifica]EDM75801.1 hypothetical protein PPSIR1_34712 [Plesiocystis pacifica SIR-1]